MYGPERYGFLSFANFLRKLNFLAAFYYKLRKTRIDPSKIYAFARWATIGLLKYYPSVTMNTCLINLILLLVCKALADGRVGCLAGDGFPSRKLFEPVGQFSNIALSGNLVHP